MASKKSAPSSPSAPAAAPRKRAARPAPAVRAKPAAAAKSASAVKAAARAAARTASTSAAAPRAPEKAGKDKTRLVRDSFTIPSTEYDVLAELKVRTILLAHPAKKSELLRAGIAALHAMTDKALVAALAAVPNLKTGRPKKA